MECRIEGCDKPLTRKKHRLCEMHYYRLRRTGDLGPPGELIVRHDPEALCVHCGNETPPSASICERCRGRIRLHGDPHAVPTHQSERNLPTGEEHHAWKEAPEYTAAHDRVRRAKGSATKQTCSCGAQAKQWAYLHNDPNELISSAAQTNGIAYSADPEFYEAMCIPCHKKFDLTRS